jgi:hypothetical protein
MSVAGSLVDQALGTADVVSCPHNGQELRNSIVMERRDPLCLQQRTLIPTFVVSALCQHATSDVQADQKKRRPKAPLNSKPDDFGSGGHNAGFD